MHEYGIAKSIVKVVLQEAEKHDAKQVKGIELLVGDFNNVVVDALRFNIEALCRDTIAAGARIDVAREELLLRCRRCGEEGVPQQALLLVCPRCRAAAVEIVKGKALTVVGIDID